ncbi:MAG: decaprenyl-phosphate phosphoribosyltransferase [Proteobacteria bacterium]|nr:decaprenyl-phosphate phosphoribosyltransferase [Pseudomonadota bacterium]
MSTPSAILVTLRPHQWVKNLFVVAPLVFSKHLFDPDHALRTAAATAVFCALSGAVYTFNDLRDVAADRLHPIKKNRPIAAGQLGEHTALTIAMILATAALVGSALLSLGLFAATAGYAAINLAYSAWLKQIAYVDVCLIAAGFLLRVIGGGLAIDVPISAWLIACTGLLALLLGFGKRAHEVALAGQRGVEPAQMRKALAGYRAASLQWLMVVLALATVAAYALYTQDPRTIAFFGTRALVWTLPCCLIGIARFLQLALWHPRLRSPTDAMLRDWLFLINIALWGAIVLVIVYRWSDF